MRFDYLKNRFAFYGIAAFLIVFSVVAGLFLPLNLGIDMTGGTTSEYSYDGDIDVEAVKASAENARESAKFNGKDVVNNVNVYKVS